MTAAGSRASAKPHVVMLTPDQVIDRRILLQGRTLVEQGFRVTILAAPAVASDAPQFAPERLFPEQVVKRVDCSAQPASARDLAHRAWSRLGREVRRLPRLRSLLDGHLRTFTRYNWEHFYWLDALYHDLALREDADVYQANDLPVLPAAVRAGRAKGVPVVYDAHELYPEQRPFDRDLRQFYSRVEEDIIRFARAVITVNESIAAEMQRRYKLERAPHVVMNGIDGPDGFDPTVRFNRIREALGLPDRVRIVLFQGAFAPHRNLESLVLSAKHLRSADALIVLMGWGEYQGDLEGLLRRHGIGPDRVRFLPAASQDVLLQFTASADVGVIPYPHVDLNSYYCTPNKLFEYIQAGLPIVANESPELRKIVGGEGIGLVHEMNSSADIAHAIDTALADRERLASFRARLLEVRQRYSWSHEKANYLAAYREVIAFPGSTQRVG